MAEEKEEKSTFVRDTIFFIILCIMGYLIGLAIIFILSILLRRGWMWPKVFDAIMIGLGSYMAISYFYTTTPYWVYDDNYRRLYQVMHSEEQWWGSVIGGVIAFLFVVIHFIRLECREDEDSNV